MCRAVCMAFCQKDGSKHACCCIASDFSRIVHLKHPAWPFFYGIWGTEVWCSMPLDTRNVLSNWFIYSPLWSKHIEWRQKLVWDSVQATRSLRAVTASALDRRKWRVVKHDTLSINVIIHLAWEWDWIGNSKRSGWIKPRTLTCTEPVPCKIRHYTRMSELPPTSHKWNPPTQKG